MEEFNNLIYYFNLSIYDAYYQGTRGGTGIYKDYSNLYIPKGLFNKIGSKYGWFRFSRLLGLHL